MEKIMYLGSSISLTESDDNICLAKAWVVIDKLSIIERSNLCDKIKQIFSKQWLCQYYSMDAPNECWQNALRKSQMWAAQECYKLY